MSSLCINFSRFEHYYCWRFGTLSFCFTHQCIEIPSAFISLTLSISLCLYIYIYIYINVKGFPLPSIYLFLSLFITFSLSILPLSISFLFSPLSRHKPSDVLSLSVSFYSLSLSLCPIPFQYRWLNWNGPYPRYSSLKRIQVHKSKRGYSWGRGGSKRICIPPRTFWANFLCALE